MVGTAMMIFFSWPSHSFAGKTAFLPLTDTLAVSQYILCIRQLSELLTVTHMRTVQTCLPHEQD